MKTVLRFIIAALVLTCGACTTKPPATSSEGPAASPAPIRGSEVDAAVPWPASTPEAQGLDPAQLERMTAWMRSSGLEFHSVIIVRNGTLVMEHYFPGWARGTKQITWSFTKSVLSALCGIARSEGKFPDLDSPALSAIPDKGIGGLDPAARVMTVRQLLTMSSGMAAMRGVDMAGAADQLKYSLEKRFAYEPGARFLYSTGGPHVVSAVLQQSVGMSARDYARIKLFEPLSIRDWSWDTDGAGVTLGGLGLSLTPIDMAKIGYLFLKNGDWFGTRVVPAEWVAESTRTHARAIEMNRAESSGYGYLWWVDGQWEGYSAHGASGKFVFVLPRKDMVVVFASGLAADKFPVPWDLMNDYVLPAAGGAP